MVFVRLFALFIFLFPISASAYCLSTPGDLTGDTETTVGDVQCHLFTALAVAQDVPLPECFVPLLPFTDPPLVSAADINCSGSVNVIDTQFVILLTLNQQLPEKWDADHDLCVDACAPIPSALCSDDNPCTIDLEDPSFGCLHDLDSLHGQPCFDGQLCTTSDSCIFGFCGGILPQGCFGYQPSNVTPYCEWCHAAGNAYGTNWISAQSLEQGAIDVQLISDSSVFGVVASSPSYTYYVTSDGEVTRFDPLSNEEVVLLVLEPAMPGSEVISLGSPTLIGPLAIFTFTTAVLVEDLPSTIIAVNLVAGETMWGYGGLAVMSSVAVVDTRLVFEYDQSARCLDQLTGVPCVNWEPVSLAGSLPDRAAPLVLFNRPTGYADLDNRLEIIFATEVGLAYAIDAETGALLWSNGPSFGSDELVSTPAGAMVSYGGYLLFPGASGTVSLYSLENGALVRTVNVFDGLEWPLEPYGSPTITHIAQDGGWSKKIALATNQAVLLMAQDCSQRELFWFDAEIVAGPIMDGASQLFLLSGGSVIQMGLESGLPEILASVIEGEVMSAAEGALYISGSSAGVTALTN